MEIDLYVFEVIVPGTWLDYKDPDWCWKIEGIVGNLQSHFFEANISLNLFVGERHNKSRTDVGEQWDRDSKRRNEIREKIEEKYKGSFSRDNWELVHFETEVELKKEKWRTGVQPREFEHNTVFIFARSFLYALDAFNKMLKVLSEEENVPEKLKQLFQQFTETFPDLSYLRNSAQHIEDRVRGLGPHGKVLDLKPIENSFINAPNGGVLVINNLNGTKYGSTMSNGHYGEVDVSVKSMELLQVIFQEVLKSFEWKGPIQHEPK
ncbi:MAG: hypothetical protein JKY45_00385 [Emcibacter sp.]|nr:hypothetical protein [Emcibacter sp.]